MELELELETGMKISMRTHEAQSTPVRPPSPSLPRLGLTLLDRRHRAYSRIGVDGDGDGGGVGGGSGGRGGGWGARLWRKWRWGRRRRARCCRRRCRRRRRWSGAHVEARVTGNGEARVSDEDTDGEGGVAGVYILSSSSPSHLPCRAWAVP
ncbi:hypothetical protein B0H13DRAFT_2038077 [Mycena leptocephala]|nr:hypothetical protein B0H13DRAFT_2038077 [Mycena leptocephala]